MEAVRQGDLGGMAVLFERHHRALFNYFLHLNGNRQMSEDLVQDVFVRMLKYSRTYQPGKPFAAWMYQIARNARIDILRQRRRTEVDFSDTDIASNDRIDDALGRKQEVAMLRKALGQLPEEKRELLILSRFQNLKYEEIAALLGCEVGAVKVRVYRAVRALANLYAGLTGEKAS